MLTYLHSENIKNCVSVTEIIFAVSILLRVLVKNMKKFLILSLVELAIRKINNLFLGYSRERAALLIVCLNKRINVEMSPKHVT